MAGDISTAVELHDELIISLGRERICYRHPENDGYIIKIEQDKGVGRTSMNDKELEGYRLLQQEVTDISFVSHCHGYVDTTLGRGLLCDCIRDHDNAVSRTIWDIIVHEENCDIDAVLTTARKLCDLLMSGRIWLFDLNPKNIALKRLADGGFKAYVIDLKGRSENKELIPVSRYIEYFSLKKLQRRSEQLLARIEDYHQRREELRKLDI
ncbi:MAG TPA: YrbL family protein [Desulfopila sp.]|nr:YrbL family protein [Desulfopila sp.]